MSAFYQIEVVQGESWNRTIPYCDAAGAPIDLSGKEVTFTVRKYHRDATPQFQLSVGSGITIGGAGNNEIGVQVTQAQNELPPGPYVFELRVNEAAGGEPGTSLLRGPYRVLAGAG